jgi:hypothetical protein
MLSFNSEYALGAVTEYKGSGPVEDSDKLGPNGETAVEAICNTYIFANEK